MEICRPGDIRRSFFFSGHSCSPSTTSHPYYDLGQLFHEGPSKLLRRRSLLLIFQRKNPSSSESKSLSHFVKTEDNGLRSYGSNSSPPRITSNVKQSLRFLKLWKDIQTSKFSTPKPATSYRRKKVQKEDLPQDQELYKDPTLSLYYTKRGLDMAVPVMLVDGYNMCGYWAKLKKHFANGQLDSARKKLIDELVSFSLVRDVKIVAVFDAMMSGLPTHKEDFFGVDVVYSAETSADAWIEKEVAELRKDGCPKVWVVTSDHCQQHAAYGAGAFIWSCKAFVSEIKASKRDMEMILQEQRSTSMQGKLLKHNLDTEVVNALKDLRNKLSEIEQTKKKC